jgi:hypothetical protein
MPVLKYWNGSAWTVASAGMPDDSFTADATNAGFSGTKKADTLTWSGQCIYKNTPTSGTIELTQITLNNLRFGTYSLNARLKTASIAAATDTIRIDVQKNVGGVFTSVALRNIKASEFINAVDYQMFSVIFDYKGAKATNNQIKIIVTNLTQASAYEIDLDYILIQQAGIGLVG